MSDTMHTRPIHYSVAETTFHGDMAFNAAQSGRRPAVLVVHEWWGRTAFTDDRALALAQAGYVGFAIDLYGNHQQAENPAQAAQLSAAVAGDIPLMTERFTAALHAIQQQPEVDPNKIAVIGYCFGGSVALSMVRQGVDLAAMVGFHAGVSHLAPIAHAPIKTPIRLFTGGADPFVPTEQVEAEVAAMRAAQADIEVVTYPAAQHAFTNPAATEKGERFNLPLQYNEAAATDSWQQMLKFFRLVFGA